MPLVARSVPPGSAIGVVTPGSPPETRAEVLRGIRWWESKGYRVKLMRGALEQEDWHAGSAEVRARDLQDAFADPEIDAVQCMRGGYGSAEVVPLLDFDAIAASPKAFIGMSDITALHAALNRFAGLATFYGPSLTSFGDPGVATLTGERLLEVLGGDGSGPVPQDSERLTTIAIAGGKASGPLLGGCLLDFIYTVGTPWEVDLRGALFFFEDVGRAPIQIDRSLLYLLQIGKLEGVRGVVVGELAGCEWHEWTSSPRSKTLEDVLEGRLGGLGVPVLYGLPLGHGSSVATLPLGVSATVDADALTLTVDEPALVANGTRGAAERRPSPPSQVPL
jgi:muramoyltetrapeptide carboxypeptidase